VWCVDRTLTTTAAGPVISVHAENVTVDCTGHALVHTAPFTDGTASYGIAGYHAGLTVRGCTVRNFTYGISAGGSGGRIVIEDNRVEGSALIGIGLSNDGGASVIRRNDVLATGSTAAAYKLPQGISAVGGTDILDNTVAGVTAPQGIASNAYGIWKRDAGGVITGNRVRNVRPGGGQVGYGIYLTNVQDASLRANDLVNDASWNGVGIRCGEPSNRVRDSVVDGFATALSNCGSAEGNYHSP
jgi:hypothetical protein